MSATVDAAKYYDPAVNGYDLDKDPRCLYGWGPSDRGCVHSFGHACFRPLGHGGECWDSGDKPPAGEDRCFRNRRPNDWDAKGRAEMNA